MGKLNEQEDALGGIAPGTVIDGRYKVVRAIGHGGNGLVHEVEHILTGRRLALKSLLDESGLARLEQEARASSLMRNDHTAKITDMGKSGPAGPYLVMELLAGQSLRELLDEAGQLPLELTVNIALQVCECLHEAHGLGIIHRDLKPENVFLCASPWPGQYDVKVLDFGIVKIAGDGPIPNSSLTRTGSTVGTPYYMSLEQLRNSSAVDARADVYSLGVVLYECLSGRKPFQADTIGDLVYALCSGPPTHLHRLRPDLAPDVCDVVMRTLSMNRDERPASMVDLASALIAHGNEAFGLWIRSIGKAPAAAARPEPPRPGALTPSHVKGVAQPAQKPGVPRPAAGAAPAGPKDNPALMETLPPPAGSFTPADESTADPPDPTIPRPRPQRPVMDSESSGGRDTPTEMYVKGRHDAPEDELTGKSASGDRDTPTRAYEQGGAIGGPQDRPFVETLMSPGVAGPKPQAPGGAFVDGDEAGWVPGRGGVGAGMPTLSPRGMTPGAPNIAFAPTQLHPSSAQSPMLATLPINTPGAPVPPAGAADKPRWQSSLDRALTSSGRFLEEMLRRFRAASQRVQLLIAIAAGGVVTVVVGLILLWLFRG